MICPYCYANIEDGLTETIKKLKSCTNCMADIHLQGEWAGNGFQVLKDLVKKFGVAAVEAEFKKTGP